MASSVNTNTIDEEANDHVETREENMQSAGTGASVITRKRKAVCWEYFDVFINKEGRERAKCKKCGNDYAVGSSSHGTHNLSNHIKKCGVATLGNQDIGQKIMNADMTLRSRKIDQEVFREKLPMAILRHNYPFMIVEHDGFRDMLSYLNPDVIHITRNTAKADCIRIYNREKKLLIDELSRIPGRITLTSDLWTSIVTEGYICLTAHYVDSSWVLRSKVLNFCHLPPPHTAPLLSEKVIEFLKDWGIDKKLFSITLDNARTCDNMQDILKSHLQNSLLCKGEFFHVRCSTHILNLIVQEGIKIVKFALDKVRESVKYVKGSEARRIRFSECCELLGVTQSFLRQDVPTRWNYTYLMLACTLKFHDVFTHFALIEPGYKFCPTNGEWDRAAKICRFLAPFHEITKLFSGTEYPTANLYFEKVWVIQVCLLDEVKSEDDVIKKMAENMLPKFEKYWDSFSVIFSIAIILDPRYKLEFVTYFYKKMNINTWKDKLAHLKARMENLFNAYASQCLTFDATPHSLSSNVSSTNHIEMDESNDTFMEFTSEFDELDEDYDNSKSELDKYLLEARFNRKEFPNLDILKYWKDNSGRYPILSEMARDIMSIPITTVASESTFSIGGKILTNARSSLTPDNAQVLVCGRNWINGYFAPSDGPTEEELLV